MGDLFQLDYFSIIDIAFSILFLVLLFIYMNSKKKEYLELDYNSYYTTNIYFKLILSLAYALYYIVIVDGGDTLAYWDGGLKMNNMFFKDPYWFFHELIFEPNLELMYLHFDMETGWPPQWIYKEPESWFISKIMTLLTFVTFKSYLVATFLLAYLSSTAMWKLFELVYSFNLNSNKNIALAVILIPSVSFWCTGVNKDTVVLYCAIMLIYHAFQILSLEKKTSLKNYLWSGFYIFMLMSIRDFMVSTIGFALIFTYSARLANKYREIKFTFYTIRVLSFIIGILFFVLQGDKITNNEKLEEAAIIQKDFNTNDTYDGKHYDIGVSDYSATGMLQAFPSAVIAGFYRPFLWESLQLTLILNGLEGTFFIYLTFQFFRRNSLRKINVIRKHEFFIFAFFFVLLLGYMAGATSGLLGVLVRFKAPLLPFLVLLLTIDDSLPERENLELENSSTLEK